MARPLTADQYAAHQARFGRSARVVDTGDNITPPRTAGQALADARHQRWKDSEARATKARQECPAAVTVILPWPPSGNHSHGQTANGGRYLLPHVRDYRAEVVRRCIGLPHLTGPYRLRVELSPPDARRRDADNAIKQLLDALNVAGLVPDDSMTYMRELHAIVNDERRGNVLVMVEATE